MAIERSLILLKPDCLDGHHAGEVIGQFEKAGFEIRGTKLIALTDELLKEHYAHIADRPFFQEIVEFASSRPCWLSYLKAKMPLQPFANCWGRPIPLKPRRHHPGGVERQHEEHLPRLRFSGKRRD